MSTRSSVASGSSSGVKLVSIGSLTRIEGQPPCRSACLLARRKMADQASRLVAGRGIFGGAAKFPSRLRASPRRGHDVCSSSAQAPDILVTEWLLRTVPAPPSACGREQRHLDRCRGTSSALARSPLPFSFATSFVTRSASRFRTCSSIQRSSSRRGMAASVLASRPRCSRRWRRCTSSCRRSDSPLVMPPTSFHSACSWRQVSSFRGSITGCT